MEKKKKILIVASTFLFYSVLLSLLYSLGTIWLSNGWDTINISPYRKILEIVGHWILPVLTGVFIIHFTGVLVGIEIFKKSITIAFFAGLFGPLWLHILIIRSPDPDAEWAYIIASHCYAVAFVVSFVVSSVICYVVKIRKTGRKN
jgi:hypothetical protein